MVASATESLILGARLEVDGVALADWVAAARAAVTKGADLVLIPDDFAAAARLDAVMLAAALAPLVPEVGIVAEVGTTVTEPFRVSTMLATLDFVSRGRAGWLASVPPAGGYTGFAGDPREAAAHVDVVRATWDSWEDGAEIRDAATHRFVDREKLHETDEAGGERFSVRGPSITPRPPQGQLPVLTREPALGGVADILLVTHPDERGPELTWGDGFLHPGLDGALLPLGELPERAPRADPRPLRERLGLRARPTNRYAVA